MQKKKAEQRFCRFQVFLAPDQIAFLKQLSRKHDRTKAHFVRQAIRLYADKLGVKLAAEPKEE